MNLYLLSVIQPEGGPPPREVLEKVMRELDVVNREIKAAGAWVFAGGLYPLSVAKVARLTDGDVLITDAPSPKPRSFWAGSALSGRPISTRPSCGPARSPVRPRSPSKCDPSRMGPKAKRIDGHQAS
jgi:hypothetical protein